MSITRLKPVLTTPEKPPKLLHEIAGNACLREIFVYSQRDFSAGCRVEETSRDYNGEKVLPYFSDRNLVSLSGEYSTSEVRAALKKQTKNEDPKITNLREHITRTIEDKKLFETCVRTPEEAHQKGIVLLDEGGYLGGDTPLGIMAYD
ncbi:MAG: hypothetical protein ACRBCT_05210 [Alphaproteobacteria bacterium]